MKNKLFHILTLSIVLKAFAYVSNADIVILDGHSVDTLIYLHKGSYFYEATPSYLDTCRIYLFSAKINIPYDLVERFYKDTSSRKRIILNKLPIYSTDSQNFEMGALFPNCEKYVEFSYSPIDSQAYCSIYLNNAELKLKSTKSRIWRDFIAKNVMSGGIFGLNYFTLKKKLHGIFADYSDNPDFTADGYAYVELMGRIDIGGNGEISNVLVLRNNEICAVWSYFHITNHCCQKIDKGYIYYCNRYFNKIPKTIVQSIENSFLTEKGIGTESIER